MIDKKLVGAVVASIAAFAGGTVVLAQLGSAVTGYGSARRESAERMNSYAVELERTATSLSGALSVMSNGLTPGAQLASRCGDYREEIAQSVPAELRSLPLPLQDNVDEICDDAALAEIEQEQQELLKFNVALIEARSMGARMRADLEEPGSASAWVAAVDGLEILKRLQSSTACGTVRSELVEALRLPAGVDIDRSAVLAHDLRRDARPSDASVPTEPVIVGPALVGPAAAGARCDVHGEQFLPAMNFVRTVLEDEAVAAADGIRAGRSRSLDDKFGDVPRSLFNPWFAVALVVGVVAWFIGRRLPKEKKDATPVVITQVDNEGTLQPVVVVIRQEPLPESEDDEQR